MSASRSLAKALFLGISDTPQTRAPFHYSSFPLGTRLGLYSSLTPASECGLDRDPGPDTLTARLGRGSYLKSTRSSCSLQQCVRLCGVCETAQQHPAGHVAEYFLFVMSMRTLHVSLTRFTATAAFWGLDQVGEGGTPAFINSYDLALLKKKTTHSINPASLRIKRPH